jgi:hypothetical protein
MPGQNFELRKKKLGFNTPPCATKTGLDVKKTYQEQNE